ncbi:MAG TPA: hypothetical protein DHW78_09430 [Ruminococcaceae bacterium]|nr:ABC transporter substrate-binding protein [Oscillospiraceae bacterium]HCM24525.1 hypothetical protein [Oscillospiraceae bacterium]
MRKLFTAKTHSLMRYKRAMAAFLALAMSISLAACGQNRTSKAADVSAPSVVSSQAVSSAPACIKVTLALSSRTAAPLLGGLYEAEAQGYFAKYGVEVTFRSADSAEKASELAASGTTQFTTAEQSTSFAQALSSGKSLTAVAALLQHSDSGIVIPASKNISRPKQLESVTCQTGSRPVLAAKLLDAVAADGGQSSALIKDTVDTVTTANVVSMLKQGETACCGSYSWDGLACREANIAANFLFFRDVDAALDDYPLLLAANTSFLKKQPKVAENFLAAAKMGYLYAAAHPENTSKLLCSKIAAVRSQQPLVQRSLTWLAGKYTDNAARWGELDIQRWNRFYGWMNQKKLTPKTIPLSTGVSDAYLP